MNRGDEGFVSDGYVVLDRGDSMPDRTTAARFLIPPHMPATELRGPAPGSWPAATVADLPFPASGSCTSLTVAASTSAGTLFSEGVPAPGW